MATRKGKLLGPRCTVLFATRTKKGKRPGGNVYVFMLRSNAEYYGYQIADSPIVKGKKNQEIFVRGSMGAASIKVPLFTSGAATKRAGKKYKSIPVPGDATLKEIMAFVKKATKNKPKSFVSPGGRTYGVK